jgi:drug/metabolite transporter (DMT)-like permease
MSNFAFGLVMASAFTHAIWNWLAKRAGGGTAFVWLFSTLSTLIYLPLALILLLRDHPIIGTDQVIFLVGTCVLHLAYYTLLSRGYRVGDLSLVYPLSRGTGPMLSTIGAILLLGERPTVVAVIGAILVTVGVFVLTGNPFTIAKRQNLPAVIYGLLTGLTIAAYTLWDKQAVSTILIPPLILTWVSGLSRALMLMPFAYRHRDQVYKAWQNHRREAFGIGILDALSYILFLIALVFSPVSYMGPARQISILFGALLGTQLLAEGDARRRLIAVGVMMIGLISLALG